MKWRVSILCENSVGPLAGTLGEHGFSALLEPENGSPLLFDTGQGLTLFHNAARMKKDLSVVESLVLSHGHYDHTGGVLPFLDSYGPRSIYGHPSLFMPRYRVKDTGESTSIGLSASRAELEAAGASFDLSTEFREIAPGVFLTGEVPRTSAFETGDRGLWCDAAGLVSDVTVDDQSLVLVTERGIVLLLGCCHAGLINTLEHVALCLGRRDFYAVIGGTHLGFCDQRQLDKTSKALRTLGIKKIIAGHCTGFAAACRLSHDFPKEFHLAQVGYTLEV